MDLKTFSTEPSLCEKDDIQLDLSDELYALYVQLIYRQSGIKLGAAKKGLLTSRLAKRMKKSGARSFTEYYRIVKTDKRELVEMLNRISTNTTNFFREPHHFEYLRDRIVPDVLKNRNHEKMIRLWSAGCSTGEEPYSMAITIHEALRMNDIEAAGWDIKILATDISTEVLEAAGTGVYRTEQLPADMPDDIIGRYFLKGINGNSGRIKVKDPVKNMVRLGRLNLNENSCPFNKQFDIIFCRNVMIYFDEQMKRHVLSMFYRFLCDRGHLFLGHSETMMGNEQFAPVHMTVYRKK